MPKDISMPTDSYSRLLQFRKTQVALDMADMHLYQNIAVKYIYDTPACGLFIDLGLGKTVISLTAFQQLWVDGLVSRCLVIAPLKVANNTWPTEISTWSHLYPLRYSLVTGELEDRKKALRNRAPIHIINRENVPWLVEQYGAKWPYDMVIIDESSSFKDHNSERFKALKKVRKLIKRVVELTASPVAEGYIGLFSQIYLLDLGQRFGNKITKYREEYFTHNQYSRKYTVKQDKRQEIIDKISDITLEMKADQYLPSKGRQDIVRLVQLNEPEMELYRTMEKELMIDIIDSTGETHVIEAQNAGVLAGKLLQMASGVIYRNWVELQPGSEDKVIRCKDAIPLHDHKIAALQALMEELDGEPIIVCYWFQSSLARLKKAFPSMHILDKAGTQVEPWNKGRIKILALHPQSAGHGLNLQKGGRNMVFFDLPASLELYEQVIGRIDRQGQKLLCRIFHLLAANTADQHVFKRLREKKDVQDWFYQRLRRYHQKVKASIEGRLIG